MSLHVFNVAGQKLLQETGHRRVVNHDRVVVQVQDGRQRGCRCRVTMMVVMSMGRKRDRLRNG